MELDIWMLHQLHQLHIVFHWKSRESTWKYTSPLRHLEGAYDTTGLWGDVASVATDVRNVGSACHTRKPANAVTSSCWTMNFIWFPWKSWHIADELPATSGKVCSCRHWRRCGSCSRLRATMLQVFVTLKDGQSHGPCAWQSSEPETAT